MDLVELLQQAQRLTNETKMDTEMPRVERTISQVLQATQELHSRVTQTGTNDLQAHILLGSKGVDLPILSQKLESLSARKSFEPLDPVTDTDVQGYLKNERENAILSVIEETNRSIFDAVELQKWRCVYAEWGEEKEVLLNALVGPRPEIFPDLQCQTVSTTLADNPLPFSRLLDNMQKKYAERIKAYNEANGQGSQRENLVATFAKLSEKFDDEHVQEMWGVLEYMADVTPLVRTTDPIHTRQTAPQFIQQARTYLERRYKTYMNTVVQKNLLVAARGGIPNTYNLVSSYVGVNFHLPRSLVGLEDISDGKPLWPLIYYSLRSGDLAAAIQFLRESGTCPDLLKLMLLQKRGDTETPTSKIETTLKLEYNNKLRICNDPYKKAVFAIVLTCDPHDGHVELMRTIDDFLWLQLSILRLNDKRHYDIEQLTYPGLQSLILDKYGENYFNAREKAPLYFQVLALTGQFESAIEFLSRTDTNRPHAVHMAIALNELCMLGTPSSVAAPLLSCEPDDPAPMKRLNLVRLIVMYAKGFEQTDTAQAMQYYYLLRNFRDAKGNNVMLNCVCDMLVENSDDQMLALVFGYEDHTDTGNLIGGIFSEFPNLDCDKYTLAGKVGDDLAERSNFESAIRLYFIAGQLDKALRLACSLISQVVHQPQRPGSLRDRLCDIIITLDSLLAVRKTDLESHILTTYSMLTQLMRFFDLVHAGQPRLASDVLAKNRLIPANSAEVDECVGNLKRMGPDIIRVLPDVMLAAMDIIYDEYVKTKGNSGQPSEYGVEDSNEALEATLRHLRGRAKALTNMAASVPYRMPNQTNQRLVQLEILMH
ncbi:nuclear pore complex protein Nup93-1 [Drosophila bipectinata]|uniref:nuclear pore complex protein Nup93-1 n=1 Tax=Drosophila bipectinata TaxID=42026 RepID=UPI0007E80A31|nr:nuclear pore complex protein Nup93-1 [Drosophila bipectinata]